MHTTLILAASTATGPLGAPLWVSIPTAINSILTGAAVVIGGTFAYIRFVRGRVLRASCEPDVEATEITLPDHTRALVVTAIIKNNGSLRLVFPEGTKQILTVSRADAALWTDACQHGEVLWSASTCHEEDLLTVEGTKDLTIKLEPGERIRRHLLVPVPHNHCYAHRGATRECYAYKIKLQIEAKPKMMLRTRDTGVWRTETIVRPC
jgi:hypothetical protein